MAGAMWKTGGCSGGKQVPRERNKLCSARLSPDRAAHRAGADIEPRDGRQRAMQHILWFATDPITRITGHQRIDCEVDGGKATKSWPA